MYVPVQTVHYNVVKTAPGLADGASVHVPVCAGDNGDFERLGFYKTAKADTAERADRADHFWGQFHFLVDRLLYAAAASR